MTGEWGGTKSGAGISRIGAPLSGLSKQQRVSEGRQTGAGAGLLSATLRSLAKLPWGEQDLQRETEEQT